jgi:1-deoxy-D-xylulose-5-phosphate reductoisomerase
LYTCNCASSTCGTTLHHVQANQVTPPEGIAILGSTGSIGTQALAVVAQQPGRFAVELLTAQDNYKLLIEQALQFGPSAVVIGNEQHYSAVKAALAHTRTVVHSGAAAIEAQVTAPGISRVLTALVGSCGLLPTISAIRAGKTICLANKETLVMAGELVMALAREHRVAILPVDSEHAALFQALVGEAPESIHKLILTASGGPFRGYSAQQLASVTLAQALKHPNWAMGAKITIDSATLMNKGLEVIEARWLFDQPAEKIEVVVHPQSIVHSLVEFVDGSLKAQLGTPDTVRAGLPHPADERFPKVSVL